MIRDMTSLQNYHSVICNTTDINGDSAPLVDKATDEKNGRTAQKRMTLKLPCCICGTKKIKLGLRRMSVR